MSLPHSRLFTTHQQELEELLGKKTQDEELTQQFSRSVGCWVVEQHSVETQGPHETCFFVLLGVIFFKDLVKFIPTPHDITTKGSLYRDVLLKLGLLERSDAGFCLCHFGSQMTTELSLG